MRCLTGGSLDIFSRFWFFLDRKTTFAGENSSLLGMSEGNIT